MIHRQLSKFPRCLLSHALSANESSACSPVSPISGPRLEPPLLIWRESHFAQAKSPKLHRRFYIFRPFYLRPRRYRGACLLICSVMAYPGQQYHMNQQTYYSAPQRPPQGQGQFYGPPPGVPPPNMASRPYNYHPPNGPPPSVYDNNFRQGQYGAPPPPPQQAQMFNQQMGQQYTFQYSNCTGKRKVIRSCITF